MTEIRIYFEGDDALRRGFHGFLSPIREKASKSRIRFHLIAGGASAEADYQTAQKDPHQEILNVLLRDSEGPNPPQRESVFWMVQLMEAWFLADPEALARYYRDGFVGNALKKNPQVEEIPKDDVLDCLKQATRHTQKKKYHKTAHAPDILALLDQEKIRKAAPNCDRLFRELLGKLDE